MWKRVALALTPESDREGFAESLGYQRRSGATETPVLNKRDEDFSDRPVEQPHSTEEELVADADQPEAPPPAIAFTSPQLEPASFPVVYALETDLDPPAPVAALDPNVKPLEEARSGSYQFPLSPLLANANQLLPQLYKYLVSEESLPKVDLGRLCEALAQGKTLHRLPKQRSAYWPASLELLIDNSPSESPYWRDYSFLAYLLQQQLGVGLTVNTLRGMEDSTPKAEACLLLSTSSLNILAYPLFRRFIQYPSAKRLILSPVDWAATRQTEKTRFEDKPLLWPVAPAISGLQPQSTGFKTPLDCALACMAPLALVDTHLLRKLRLGLGWGGAELEGEVWNHPDIEFIGLGVRLRRRLSHKNGEGTDYEAEYAKLDGGAQKRLREIVTEHFKGTYDGLKNLQLLNFELLKGSGPADMGVQTAVTEYIRRLIATATQDRGRLNQCKTYLEAMPECAYQQAWFEKEAYQLFDLVYANKHYPDRLPTGFDPNKLPSNNAQREPSRWLLRQTSVGEVELLREQDAPVYLAPQQLLAELHCTQDEPLRLLSAQSQQLITRSQTLTLSETPIELKTGQTALKLRALTCPPPAELEFSQGQPSAVIAHQGQRHPLTLNNQTGEWQLPHPFGQDEYGVYLDQTLFGEVQRFRYVRPGEFLMGSPEEEKDRDAEREVQHQVRLTQGFWLADTTVTQTLWQAVMGENPSEFEAKMDEALPVDSVSWLNAKTFIDKLTAKYPELALDLPTEAQWEYACRAGTETSFSVGETLTKEQANFAGSNSQTVDVKCYPPNPWGLYQMHGNLWEWCLDEYRAQLVEPAERRDDPIVGEVNRDSGYRVLRGGAWSVRGQDCRSAYRLRFRAVDRYQLFGLRLSLGLDELEASGARRASHAEQVD